MSGVIRGEGATESERVLAKIAEKSFLDLWTYPNLYRAQKLGGKGDGKELCDLLVVCGDDVLIFSDKVIKWPEGQPTDVAWCRWYKKAIDASVKQIRGAERWLREFPDRIFLDSACTKALPIDLPPLDRRRVHGVAIVDGASMARRQTTGSPDGHLLLNSLIKGRTHYDKDAERFQPFVIGDVDPDGPFVHVFDHRAIWTVLRLFDTIVDFTTYLDDRADAIRSGHLYVACGEDDIAAFYLSDIDEENRHTFHRQNGSSPIGIIDGTFQDFVGRPEFRSKQAADKISYMWDELIRKFTKHILGGTSEIVIGERLTIREHEEGIRAMALTNRVYRRVMGARIQEAIQMSIGKKNFRMARVFMPDPEGHTNRCGFVFVVLSIPEHLDAEKDYTAYREFRVAMIAFYCQVLLVHNPELDIAVGIGVDAPDPARRRGGSEDCITAFQREWSEEAVVETIQKQQELGILPEYRGGSLRMTAYEYPSEESVGESRQQRRQRERQEAKARRRH